MPVAINREHPHNNPGKEGDEQAIAREAWLGAGGELESFERWWKNIDASGSFDSVKALASVAWQTASDRGFAALWADIVKRG